MIDIKACSLDLISTNIGAAKLGLHFLLLKVSGHICAQVEID